MRRRSLLGGLVGMAVIGCRRETTPAVSPTLTADNAVPLTLTSEAFQPNGAIPDRYTCDRDNLSPPLAWSAPPAGSQSWVLIVDDPDAPGGTFTHWVLYNLPISVRQLPVGLPPQPKLVNGGVQGSNDFGQSGYGGPCPPSGTHRYVFHLYAIDRQLDQPPGATSTQILTAIAGHSLGAGTLTGHYTRPR